MHSVTMGLVTSNFCSDTHSAPGHKLNLKGWKLQLPTHCGSGVCEIDGDKLKSYHDKYFHASGDGAATFCVPLNGAHTGGSHYPRSELREHHNFKLGGSHSLKAKMKILSVSRHHSKKETIVGQIHGEGGKFSSLVKLRYNENKMILEVRVKDKGGKEINAGGKPVASDVSLGHSFEYELRMEGHHLTAKVDGHTVTHNYDYAMEEDSSQKYYFKAGNYLQDHQDTDSDGAVVAFSEISTHHSGGSDVVV